MVENTRPSRSAERHGAALFDAARVHEGIQRLAAHDRGETMDILEFRVAVEQHLANVGIDSDEFPGLITRIASDAIQYAGDFADRAAKEWEWRT